FDDGMQLWVAEANGQIVSAGRLEPVRGTDFAGIWGGATRLEWRGRGIYRALTAARARSALRMGKTLINSDSTEYSRPILERSGLVKVSTTTPYRWHRSPRPGITCGPGAARWVPMALDPPSARICLCPAAHAGVANRPLVGSQPPYSSAEDHPTIGRLPR